MSPDLTPEQRAAAEREGGDACVMAGAGSGKTTVLTARVRTLVARGIDLRRTACLTFTEAAAHEMRARLTKAFADEGGAAGRALARDAAFAPISTIHAFGARLLREHAIDAGVDPSFSVLDEDAARRLLDEAWDAVERRARRGHDPRLLVLRRVGDESAADALLDLHGTLRGLEVAPGDARLRRGPALPAALERLGRALDDARGAIAARRLDPAARAACDEALARLPSVERLSEGGFDAARAACAVGGLGKGAVLPCEAREVKPARNEVIAAYAEVAGALLDEVAAAEVEEGVRFLLGAVDAEYAARKREAHALDYADLERESVALLDRWRKAGTPFQGRPMRLLVDEFQDTNPLQARLLALLRDDGRRRVDLFAVGDPKQSIYGFRGADVEVMLAEWEKAGPAGRASLTESFRSRPELVAFHNALFARLFAAGAGGVAPAAMVGKPGAWTALDREIPPEVLVVEVDDPDADRVRLEAEAVARRVRAWIDDDSCVRTKAKHAGKKIRARDVAVLLRARTHQKAYERALLAQGIPFHVGRGKGFFGTEEIVDLVHLLRVVHDPRDDFAVAAWMTSPAVGATDEDLLETFRSTPEGTRFEAAARRPRVRAAAEAVRRLRVLAARSDLAATVRAAIDVSDALPVAMAQDGGSRRAKNLEKAVAIARRLDGDGRHGLGDLLRWLSDLRDREIDEPEAPAGAEEDSLALLTIHAAKGLEWPCVVLAGASSPQGNGRAEGALADGEGRFAWRLVDPLEGTPLATGGYLALRDERKAAEDAESLRLLYVALTRAEERLVISMSRQPQAGGRAGARYGWGKAIWEALSPPEEEGEHAVDLDGARAVVRVVAAGSPRAEAGARRPADPEPDDALLAEAAACWERARTPVETLGRLPYVVTVSDLLRFADSPPRYYEERVALSSRSWGASPPPAPALAREPDDPASGREDDDATEGDETAGGRDESDGEIDGIDRTALGRAVHLALERYDGAEGVGRLVDEALEEEPTLRGRAPARALARAMVERFARSPLAAELVAAGAGARREEAFHARIAFPEKEPVEGYDSLLVKGTVDLWLPRSGDAWVLDYKTNSPRGSCRGVDALAEHYGPQLRLYALAIERVTGRRVAGASLVLLDPAWDGRPAPVEVAVDVSGPRLLEARRLCRAFALACRLDRWPRRWDDLLATEGARAASARPARGRG